VTSLSSVLFGSTLPPARATRVFPRLPAWLVEALNSAYTIEVTNHFGRRLRNLDDTSNFLRVLEREFGCKVFDHCGSDVAENFIAEPYAATCSKCMAAARKFALRLGVRFTVSLQTYHAAGSDGCVRFTFYKPGVQR
jgi:hypothetical protein